MTQTNVVRQKAEMAPRSNIGYIRMHVLVNHKLRLPLDAIVEPDDQMFIARSVDLPLYGTGDDPIEALNNLKMEIESLYDDLNQDDKFTPDWLRIKAFLNQAIEN